MRWLVPLLFIATPAAGWEFSPVPVCTLRHDEPGLSIRVTWDPARAEPYAIALTRPAGWPAAATFGIRFDGARPLTIGTSRQRLSADGATLTVSDTGFGNVLDGLEFNRTAAALAGGESVPFSLSGAPPAVQAFRACGEAPAV